MMEKKIDIQSECKNSLIDLNDLFKEKKMAPISKKMAVPTSTKKKITHRNNFINDTAGFTKSFKSSS